jgi:hypothetical protein
MVDFGSAENFRYLLRSGMLGWFSLILDTRRWAEQQRADARVQFALYRSALRPLIRGADLYTYRSAPTECTGTASRTGVFRESGLESGRRRQVTHCWSRATSARGGGSDATKRLPSELP